MAIYQIQVLDGGQVVYSNQFTGPLEMGRRQTGEREPYSLTVDDGLSRLVIAPHEEVAVARKQLKVVPGTTGIELVNLSKAAAIEVIGGEFLAPGTSRVVGPSTTVQIGARVRVSISRIESSSGLHFLPDATIAPGRANLEQASISQFRSNWKQVRDAQSLVRSLQATMDVFQCAVKSQEFFRVAAESAVELVGLDSASVVLFEGGRWTEPKASGGDPRRGLRPASRHVLEQVLQHRRTYWDSGMSRSDGPESLVGLSSVIAAPILDRNGAVIGAVYGDRSQISGSGNHRPIVDLDAMLLELLACGVASGLSRMTQEFEAHRLRMQFERFFTRELAQELEECPTLLDGRDAVVTTLFCDIRGFSRISDRIGTEMTFDWINDVMETLTESVTGTDGVLVDYIGDELVAMWGAPKAQPDHAARACRAALDMLARLPRLNKTWQQRVGEPIDVGIGMHTGMVRAGNCGSKHKLKYGPLGPNVNLASRVQGATKYLKTSILITGATAESLGKEFPTRKLCDVKVVNIPHPTALHELMPHPEPESSAIRQNYEGALERFERENFRASALMLSSLLDKYEDGPSLVLLSRVVQALIDGRKPDHHPVWELPGK